MHLYCRHWKKIQRTNFLFTHAVKWGIEYDACPKRLYQICISTLGFNGNAQVAQIVCMKDSKLGLHDILHANHRTVFIDEMCMTITCNIYRAALQQMHMKCAIWNRASLNSLCNTSVCHGYWLVCLQWLPEVTVSVLSTWLVVCCWCHLLSCLLSAPSHLVTSSLFHLLHLCLKPVSQTSSFVSLFILQVSVVLC